MNKHSYTEPSVVNFSKLEDRIMAINDSNLGKFNDVRRMIYDLSVNGGPTLIMATGGSKVVAYYLQLILERTGNNIVQVIEPRDYFYMANKDSFSNLIVISASGKTNGVGEALDDFTGDKYLVSENAMTGGFKSIAWGNELYGGEKSFISLAASLGPVTLLLDAVNSINLELSSNEIQRVNDRVKELIKKSNKKIDDLDVCFKDTSLVQIMSGYDTKVSSNVLESNLTECGLAAAVVHDKGSYCHGRSNLLVQYPNSHMIYLAHDLKELDYLLTGSIGSEYPNLSLFDTGDLDDDIFWREYYLMLQMYFLSRKIADDKGIDLTQPEYNPRLVKKMYNFRGEM